jgi:hypothetical protein
MITFGNNKIKLTSDRKSPDKYDLMWWGPTANRTATILNLSWCVVQFEVYNGHVIEAPYAVGFKYHIMTYPNFYNKKSDDVCIECYKACLINPLDYAEGLAGRYYGVIGKVSDRSDALFYQLFLDLKKDGNLKSLFKEKVNG